MPTFAASTSVSSEKSRLEIERTLSRYGADKFMYGWDQGQAMIAFKMEERQVRFLLPMPEKSDYRRTPTGRARNAASAEREWEQATRQRWRALALVVKAKLEAVESGIAEFEEEFLAYIMLPDGTTVGEYIRPQVEASYDSGLMPQLALPRGSE